MKRAETGTAQRIITPEGNYGGVDRWIRENGIDTLMLVCDASLPFLRIRDYLEGLEKRITVVRFGGFSPNPRYESVTEGVRLFREAGCTGIMAVGGGSAMDVAKCVMLYAGMPGDGADGTFLSQRAEKCGIPFLAMPTTAGTGSEVTRYAVIYYGGKKQSVTDERCIPGTVLMDPSALETLPLYQKKATMLDALCHAAESAWSVHSTEESRAYSREAIRGILSCMDGYLANEAAGNAGMLRAAHLAGKAINITQTTAGHAMCYKITGLFGCAHGHAAALCDRVLFPWMAEHTDRCIDPRGEGHLREALDDIGRAMGGADARDGARRFAALFRKLEMAVPKATEAQLSELRANVNPERLRNHPVALDGETIGALYREILG